MDEPERYLQGRILQYLAHRGILARPTHGKRNHPLHVGSLDISGILPGGRALEIEVKTKRGRVSSEQQKRIEDVTAQGGLAFMARDLETVIEAVTTAMRKTGRTDGVRSPV